MEFRILGPLQVLDEGRELSLGGAKQRALLALLLLDPNRVVSRDRLIDELWGALPPATAPTALQVYVSQLRCDADRNGHARTFEADDGRLEISAHRLTRDASGVIPEHWRMRAGSARSSKISGRAASGAHRLSAPPARR
jgi:DNA-binding SARP family transcriptional activator